MSGMLRKLIILVTFVVGLGIFFYPIVSDWLSTKEHYSVITQHNEALAAMSEEMKEKELQKAKEYNNEINENSIPYDDPFSENFQEEANGDYFNILDVGETMGSIEIPSIGVKIPIYHGVSEDVLSQGIGHMSNSSLPVGGEGTHSALTGHRGLPSSKLFRDLDEVKMDDVFYIHTLGETLAYQVEDIQVVLPTETSWLEMKEDEDLVTLITCEPYMINTHRMLVRGTRIPVPYEETDEVTAVAGQANPMLAESGQSSSYFMWGVALGALLLVVLVIFYFRLRKGSDKR